jgi:hypothetical protein
LGVFAVIHTASALNMNSALFALKHDELQGLGPDIYPEEMLGGLRITRQHVALSNRVSL